ncbi:hypothetical protein VN97_g12421 [Penicillium thymicola]|uniref:Helicase-associated domain-containing protein n=1 Tax=Penicillium thymicola TaxID=293382 RepID=A0AAI9T6Z7_PENTH|nr:hypothetical protein VN97_g12421 [Penicillium thymicola]
MATGTSACMHSRNINKGCLFVRNEACSNPHRGLTQSIFPQSSQDIHTIYSTTTPLRSTRKLHLLGPIIAGNPSALKGHRPTTGAHYSTYSPPLLESAVNKVVSNKSPADDLLRPLQQYTPATVHLPIQRKVLSTIKDARKVLEYANRDMLWADASRRKNELRPRIRIRRLAPKDVTQGTAKWPRSKHRPDTCDSPFREELEFPVRLCTKQILSVINSNTYSIIDEEIDSGKAIQVPQIIVEDAINTSRVSCMILSVQLNESEAVNMTHRMAHDRSWKLGDTAFHKVPPHHIARLPWETIRYCSRQDLLRILKDGPSILKQFSHIILDDVHFRDFNIEVGMMLLKRFIEKRKGASVPKVILMGSFTHINELCSYFGTKTTDGTLLPAPHMTVPRGFPVKKYYLEGVMDNINRSSPPEIRKALLHKDEDTQSFLASNFKWFEKLVRVKINRPEKDVVPCGLVSATLLSLLSTTKTGSIIAFVPRHLDFMEVTKQIRAFGPKLGFDFADKDRFRIIHLCSNPTAEEKAEIQLEYPPGCRRIFISKERSAFTIPDVRYVVDSGKSMGRNLTNELSINWISGTVASQRAECTGGVQASEYYFLGTKERFDSLSVTPTPLLSTASRSNLQQACLHVKRATPGRSLSIAELFAQTSKPPKKSRVCAAVDDLKELQLLDEQEELTALGHILVDLNMDPSLGKMVALGVIFQCLDPMLILASLDRNPDLFSRRPSSPDPGVDASFVRSINESGYHVAITNILGSIRQRLHHQEGEPPALGDKVSQDYLSQVYHTVTPKIGRIIKRLIAAKFISADKSFGDGAFFSYDSLNTNSKNEALIKTLLLQCLSSNLAVKPFGYTAIKFKSGEIVERDPNYSISKNYIMAYNFGSARANKRHGTMQKTQVNPLAACVLGSKIEQEEENVILDSWVKIKPQKVGSRGNEVAKDLVQTHKAFNEALRTAFKVLPRQGMPSFDSSADWNAYRVARAHLFKTIQKSLQDILHAHDPLAQSTRKDI